MFHGFPHQAKVKLGDFLKKTESIVIPYLNLFVTQLLAANVNEVLILFF